MTVRKMVLNETAYFGAGARQFLASEARKRGFHKALVVTDKELVKHHVVGMVQRVLDEADIPYEVYDYVKPNPTIDNVQKGVTAFKRAQADFIVAIGGGSPMDTAKGIGIIVNNPEHADVASLEGLAPTRQRSVPIVALPTTAGTAAEVTINYVITNEAAVKKMVCVDPNDIPVLSIVDSELMASMPKNLAAATGMDALTHAIEGYITKGAWVMSDMFELKAIEMIVQYLERAVQDPSDAEALEGMALAQYIAGMGFSNAGLGIVHSMAHPLGAFYDIPHGVANGLLLPYVMEYNAQAAGDRFPAILHAMRGGSVTEMSREDAITATIDAVKQLSIHLHIPQKLNEIGVKEEDLEKLAAAAFNDVCTPGNPGNVTVSDILAIYRKAFR